MIRSGAPVFWILLVVSTLAIGGLALTLLWREGRRVDALAKETAEARGRTIIENLGLLVQEVKTGVLDSLATLPEGNLDDTVARWRDITPFVDTAFLWHDRDGVRVPGLVGDAREHTEDELRRVLAGAVRPDTDAGAFVSEAADDEWEAPMDYAPVPEPAYVPLASQRAAIRDRIQSSPEVGALMDAAPPAGPRMESAAPSDAPTSRPDRRVMRAAEADGSTAVAQAKAARPLPSPVSFAPADRGWDFREFQGRRTWIGWHRAAGSPLIRGVVLSRSQLEQELNGALPERIDAGQAFEIRDPNGDRVAGIGTIYGATATFSLPAGNELPGWSLIIQPNRSGGVGRSFVWLGGALTAILMVSLFAGGTLLIRQARREAHDAARRTTFVTNVSHELKSPLTTIRMYAELLGEGRIGDARKRSGYLDTIVAECERLTRLINNVLDFSRLEKNAEAPPATTFDVAEAVRRIVSIHRPRIEAACVFDIQIPNDPLPVRANPDALEQAVVNLLDNAVKYAAAGGQIEVRVAPSNGQAIVVVADRGPGIPEALHEKVFESFARGDLALTAPVPGAGLGLHIARRLLRQNGGDLTLHPINPSGCRFEIRLPIESS